MQNEKAFDTGELTLNYFEGGAGSPMVLLHGVTAWWQAWDTEIPELTSKWHVYALDFRGHGKSGRIENQYRAVDYARDITAFLKQVGEPAVLIGHSLGGLVAFAAAAAYSEGVRAVVSVDPGMFLRNSSIDSSPGWKDYTSLVYETAKSSPSRETMVVRCRTKLMPESSETEIKAFTDRVFGVAEGAVQALLRDQLLDGLDLASALQSIKCPTLVLQGDWEDGGAMRHEDADFVRANLPTAVIDFIPNGSHLFPEVYADTILQHVNAFLASV